MYAADVSDLGTDRAPEDMVAFVRETLALQGAGQFTFVDLREGAVSGVLLASSFFSLKVNGRALWIEALFVKPEYRRRGVARALVEHLLDWAEGASYQGIELESYGMNTAASILFRDLDFKRLARERYCHYFRQVQFKRAHSGLYPLRRF